MQDPQLSDRIRRARDELRGLRRLLEDTGRVSAATRIGAASDSVDQALRELDPAAAKLYPTVEE